MKTLKNFITENIASKIKASKDPMFVMVIGGTASGKNYWFDRNLQGQKLIDLDQYILQLTGDPSADRSKFISKAVQMAKKEMTSSFEKKTTVVQIGSGSNFKGTFNKFKLAKSYGMKTALILISVDPEVAIKRNAERIKKGGHGKTLPDKKIISTNQYSRETFDKLRKTKYIDHSAKIEA